MDFLKNAKDSMLGKRRDEDFHGAEDQTNDERELAAWLQNKLEDSRLSGSRVAHEGTWMTNIAYMLGFDSIYYDTTTKQYRLVGNPNSVLRRERTHVNKILPTVQRRKARITKNKPRWEVRPSDETEQAKDKARLEKKLVMYYWDKLRIDEKRAQVTDLLQECGHGYMFVCFDEEEGELISDCDEHGNYMFEGDLRIDVESAFNVFPDPQAKNFEDIRYLYKCKVRPLEYFRAKYPERGHAVKAEGVWIISLQHEQRINSLVGQGPAQTGIAKQSENSAIEVVYYERKSKQRPMGRMVTMANGVILEDKPLPVGEIPAAKFDDIAIGGKYYSEACVTHLRPIQDQYNRNVSKRAQWVNRMLSGKLIAAKGTALEEDALNDESGEVVYYTPVPNAVNNGMPMAMQMPAIPQYAYQEDDYLNANFYDIAGEGEVSRGNLPSASIPAIGMQLLLEQDETRINLITMNHEQAFSRLARLMLMYIEKFVSNERKLKLAGPNNEYIVKKWSGASIADSDHDIIVKPGSLAPQSRAVARNDILNLYQSGLLGEPADPMVRQKVLGALEFGDIDSVWEDQALDMAQIKETLELIEKGIAPIVDELDNHALHIQEKNRYRKSDKYKMLDTERQAILKANIEEHVQHLMKITAPQFGMAVDQNDDVMPLTGEPKGVEDVGALRDRADALESEVEGMNEGADETINFDMEQ